MTLTETTAASLTADRARRASHPETTEARYPNGPLARRLDAAVAAGALGHLGTVTNLWVTADGDSGWNQHRYETTTWDAVVFVDGTVAQCSTGIDCAEMGHYGYCRTPKQHATGQLHLHNSEMDTDDTVYAKRLCRGYLIRRDGRTLLVPAKRALAYLTKTRS
jgi:hypothetical protein